MRLVEVELPNQVFNQSNGLEDLREVHRLPLLHHEIVIHELDQQLEEVRRSREVQLLAMVNLSKKLLQEEDGRSYRQGPCLYIETHELNCVLELPPQACSLREEALVDEHGHDLFTKRMMKFALKQILR